MEPEVRERFEWIESILAEVGRRNAEAMARMDKAEARMDKADARMDKAEARFEKRMKGFEKLVMIGMRELAQLRRLHKEHDEKLNALIDSQLRTEASLRRMLESLRRSSNGR